MSVGATLPLVLFVVLFEVAVGGTMLMWLLDRTGEAPPGFLRLTGIVGVAAASFAALVGPSLPPVAAPAAQAGVVVAVLVAVYFVATLTPARRLRDFVGATTAVAGLLLLVLASRARPGDPFDVLALTALPLGALALGGVDAAMLLGHWYLVTPKLSPTPLQRASLVFFVAVVAQAVVAAFAIGRGDLAPAWETSPLAVGIRLGLGLGAPAVIALGAWWTARLNTQSSTGLLYVALGMVLAGELSARILFFVRGAVL